MSKYWGDYLKKGTLKCPRKKCKKEKLHFEVFGGMRMVREVTPRKPKKPYYVYYAKCPLCFTHWHVKAR